MYEIAVRHNFETAHRLPHLEGKCQSLHGHSWWATVTVRSPVLRAGILVEFGPFKKALREWIDTHLDHGTMLGYDDPLLPVLRAHGCKVYEFVHWPTVEEVASEIGFKAKEILSTVVRASGAEVARCDVRETHVNQASWTAYDAA